MKSYSVIFSSLTVVVLTGCAPYSPAPLTTSHPAHQEAFALPRPPLSNTLAYTKADFPTAFPVQTGSTSMTMDMMKEGHGSSAGTSQTSETAVGEGSVVAVIPSSSQIVLDHGEIKNFMDAMTMGYRVASPDLLQGLNQGDKVRFTIAIDQKAIIKVEKLK